VNSDERYRAKRMWRRRLYFTPFRVAIGLLVLSLPAGGPQVLYLTLPGQFLAVWLLLHQFSERYFQGTGLNSKKVDKGTFAWGRWAFVIGLVLSIVEYRWWPTGWRLWPWAPAWVVVAAVLFAFGQTVRVLAIRTLGRFFTFEVRIHEAHEVIQHGLYAFVRHPSYLGLLFVGVAIPVAFASQFGLLAFVVLSVPAIARRIRVEEQVLSRELGEPYREYCGRTKRLIPYVY